MIKPVMKDEMFLRMPCDEASELDLSVAQDLIDTLKAHANSCVGMAANMIGVRKRIIVFDNAGKYQIMLNPEVVSKAGEYETNEGCLSLTGVRACTRYKTIKVKWFDENMRPRQGTFQGFTAQIIQHEIDHCNGIII